MSLEYQIQFTLRLLKKVFADLISYSSFLSCPATNSESMNFNLWLRFCFVFSPKVLFNGASEIFTVGFFDRESFCGQMKYEKPELSKQVF